MYLVILSTRLIKLKLSQLLQYFNLSLIYGEIIQPKSKWPDFKVYAQAFMLYIQSLSTCLLEFKSLIISYKAVATSGLNVLSSQLLTWLASLPKLEVYA